MVDGDIVLDVPARRIELEVPADEFDRRMAALYRGRPQ